MTRASRPSFFEARRTDGREVLLPSPAACGGWGGGQIRGMAIGGALARATEAVLPAAAGWRPARWHLELFRAAAVDAVEVSAEVVRLGRRLCLVDAVMTQGGRPVSRASLTCLQAQAQATGEVWTPRIDITPPPADLSPLTDEPRLCYSEGVGWTGSAAAHANASRKQTWHLPTDVVAGEPLTPFQLVASTTDVANVVANWGSEGLVHINTDVSVALTRLPAAMGVGLAVADRVEADGIAVASVHVYDADGVFGLASVTAMANPGSLVVDRRGGQIP